ncbi:Glycosyl transferase group 1 [Verrucomicrobia bacterium]|nr:Glycosyl transferase group 1 [Verrucomicrobiota bacterium]
MRTVHLLRKLDPAEWGGTETAIQRLFAGLREQGVTPVAYCPRLESRPAQEPPQWEWEVQRFRSFVPVWGISKERKDQMVAVGGNLMSYQLVAALWRERQAALIHTHTLGRIGGIGRTVAKRRGLPFVVSIHGGVLDLPADLKASFNAPVDGGWEWGKLFGWLFQSHRLFSDADAIITCNDKEAALLQQRYPAKRVVVQPHGVPLALYQQDHRAEARAAFPQIAERPVLLNVGRIDPVKNQSWLLDRAPVIFQKHPRLLLVLAGACTDRPYGELIGRKIEQLGLRDRVLLTGGLPPNDPRLIGLLQEAAAVVLPSVSETFGLVILEAWAAGAAVLSSRASGPAALVQSGHNGWLFDLDRPETFHEGLDRILGDASLARQMARRGAEVSRQYGVGVLAGRVKRLYEELIEERLCAT